MTKYTKLQIEEDISIGQAIGQAAQAADLAGSIAASNNDAKTLVEVANAWSNITNSILALLAIESDLDNEESKDKSPYGFGGAIK